MGIRFPYLILLLVLALGACASIILMPSACNDPAGCLRLSRSQPIVIGTSILTSGSDRPISLEIQQAAQLAALDISQSFGFPLTIQPFYSTCLPGEPVPASIDLAAADSVIAVLGPACSEETADFFVRMSRASKAALSPIPWRVTSGTNLLSFSPDRAALVKQAAGWLRHLGYKRLLLLADVDQDSQTFAQELCAQMANILNACTKGMVGEILPPDQPVDALVEVTLGEKPFPMELTQDGSLEVPRVMISLSNPILDPSSPLVDYWIAPRVWLEIKPFLQNYEAAFHNQPTSLAAWAAYDSLKLIYQSLQSTAIKQWDGSMLIPRQSFIQQILKDGKEYDLFQYTCMEPGSSCVDFPLVLFQRSGNEYRLANP